MTYYRVTFDRKVFNYWVPVPVAIALDCHDSGPDRIRQALECRGYSSINILGLDPSLSNKFRLLAAAGDSAIHGYEKLGDIELVLDR
jgi:hypothetical protein